MSRAFRQWDLVLVPYPHPEQPHYLVVISPDWVAGNPDFRTLNGLICHTIRPPDRPPRPHEVFLDTADGLDHKTVCRCHIIVEFVREKALPQAGKISRYGSRRFAGNCGRFSGCSTGNDTSFPAWQ